MAKNADVIRTFGIKIFFSKFLETSDDYGVVVWVLATLTH